MSAVASLDICRWLQGLGLRPVCLLVAHAIGHRLNEHGEAWPSLNRLARDTGLHRRTVMRALNELEAEGVITRMRQWREDGSAGATVYTFGGQWDLFRERAGARRRSRGGVGAESPDGGGDVTRADLRPERDHVNGARENARSGKGAGGPDRCERTFDIEVYMERTEAARVEAARRGFGGPWDDASVRGFLDKRD